MVKKPELKTYFLGQRIADILYSFRRYNSVKSFNTNLIYLLSVLYTFTDTPRKTNMEPENERLEEEILIRNHHFQVPC